MVYIPAAFTEVGGIASVMPFLGAVANPNLVRQNAWMKEMYQTMGFTEIRYFLLFLGLSVLIILLVSNALLTLSTWLTQRYCWKVNHQLSQRLFHRYLQMPYSFYLTINTSSLAKGVLTESTNLIGNVLMPVLDISAKALICISVFVCLLLVDAKLAVVVMAVLGGAYAMVYKSVRWRLTRASEEIVSRNSDRYRVVSEAFGGIKEVKLKHAEEHFRAIFCGSSRAYCKEIAVHEVISRCTRHFIESIAFGGILIIVLYLLFTNSLLNAIPIIGIYAFAAYRVLPSLQQMFIGMTKIRSHQAILNIVSDELSRPVDRYQFSAVRLASSEQLVFQEHIELENIAFSYPSSEQFFIREASLVIPKNSRVAIVGRTGAGKTTLVDIILGLLHPQTGRILVDGVEVEPHNLRAWQKKIGCVPQHFHLCDDTVLRNIAFGVSDADIDHARVESAAKLASIHQYIMSDLPSQYDSLLGEKGLRLSGGQRQRIAIARALYRQPEVLVFDEATSALDSMTEDLILDAIEQLGKSHTIITIAHRMSTLKVCDLVVFMEKGKLVASGTYEKLYKECAGFRDLASASWKANEAIQVLDERS